MIEAHLIERSLPLSHAVAERLARQIRSGEFALGVRLPPERELATMFGVSRVVVREAMSRLKSEGLIETRQGSGAFVAGNIEKASFQIDILNRGDLRQLFELRLSIEGTAASLAALHGRSAEKMAIRLAVEQLRDDVAAGRSGTEADAAFHRAIAAASGNRYVERFTLFLGAHLRSAIAAARSNTARRHAARIVAVQDEHEAILAAILAANGVAAEAAMKLHLANAADRLGLTRAPSKPSK
jgi:GntR family transcriptional regulator, transcriptional repressor for pyruvate dehydrogenase complex